MKTALILNGPNLNLLGTREPAVYGGQTLADVEKLCAQACASHGFALDFRQSNHEGELVDWLHEAGRLQVAGTLGGVILNAAAYTLNGAPLQTVKKSIAYGGGQIHASGIAQGGGWVWRAPTALLNAFSPFGGSSGDGASDDAGPFVPQAKADHSRGCITLPRTWTNGTPIKSAMLRTRYVLPTPVGPSRMMFCFA